MSNQFRNWGAEAPGMRHVAITPHASNNIDGENLARAIYVGVGGDIAIVDAFDDAVVYKAVPQGAVLPMACKRVNAIGTTATNMVAMF